MPEPSKLYFEMPIVDNEKTESLTGDQLSAYLNALAQEPDQNAAILNPSKPITQWATPTKKPRPSYLSPTIDAILLN